MGDNLDPLRRSRRKKFRRRAERALNRDMAILNLRQLLNRGNRGSDSGDADSEGDEERVNSEEEVPGDEQEVSDAAARDIIIDPEVEDINHDPEVAEGAAVGVDLVDEVSSDSEDATSGSSSDSDNAAIRPPEDLADMMPEWKEAYLKESLREWASSGGVLSMRKVDELLGKLAPVFRSVPKSYKTLLDTAPTVELNLAEDHKMWYKGIKAYLDQLELDNYVNENDQIVIDIAIDGLPLPTKKFWPILGRLVGSEEPPFEIAIYYGSSDPKDTETFLGDFVIEVADLMRNGYELNDVTLPVVIRNFILDAPARSLVKCCIGHCGYGACEKCHVVGEYSEGRINFANVPQNCELRTDQSFREKTDRLHHTGRSPLELLDIGMVSQFRLDSMHLVYKGVFLRFLEAVFSWEGDWNLEPATIEEISQLLEDLKQTCPKDFNRKGRKILEYYKYKITELRRLLLYDGLVAFKDKFGDEIYSLFLLLHSATYILCNNHLLQQLDNDAENFIDAFITYSSRIFGQHFIVYNVHSLTHMVAECRQNGVLESFSAFPFENRLKTIKETLRSGFLPLEQMAKRDSERREKRAVKMKRAENVVELGEPRKNLREQYKRICVNGTTFKVNHKDNCFMTDDGSVFLLQNIVKGEQNNILFCGRRFRNSDDFYSYPIKSSQLGIFKVWQLNDASDNVALENVVCKCWLMKSGNEFVSVPINHSLPLMH